MSSSTNFSVGTFLNTLSQDNLEQIWPKEKARKRKPVGKRFNHGHPRPVPHVSRAQPQFNTDRSPFENDSPQPLFHINLQSPPFGSNAQPQWENEHLQSRFDGDHRQPLLDQPLLNDDQPHRLFGNEFNDDHPHRPFGNESFRPGFDDGRPRSGDHLPDELFQREYAGRGEYEDGQSEYRPLIDPLLRENDGSRFMEYNYGRDDQSMFRREQQQFVENANRRASSPLPPPYQQQHSMPFFSRQSPEYSGYGTNEQRVEHTLPRQDLHREDRPIIYDEYGNALRKKRPPPPDGYEYVEDENQGELSPGEALISNPEMTSNEEPANPESGVNEYYSRPIKLVQNRFMDAEEMTWSRAKYGITQMNYGNDVGETVGSSSQSKPVTVAVDMSGPGNSSHTDDALFCALAAPGQNLRRVIKIHEPGVTSLQILNQKYPGLEWEILKQGPVHRPAFTAQVTINGELFTGFGGNKKEARLNCADNVVEAMQGGRMIDGDGYTSLASTAKPGIMNPVAVKESHLVRRAKRLKAQGVSTFMKKDIGKTPIQLIYERCIGQKVEFELVGQESIPPNNHAFTVQCSINGSRFYGTAKDKKSAKQNAAKQALNDLFNWIPPTTEEQKRKAGRAAEEEKAAEILDTGPLCYGWPLQTVDEDGGEVSSTQPET